MKFKDVLRIDDRRETLESFCRNLTKSTYVGQDTALCRVLGSILMYVPTRDLSISPHLLMGGFWEMWVTMAITNYVKPGMVCLDVGANSGYFTMLLADLTGALGHVRAYEPQYPLVKEIRRSAAINGYSQVSVVGAAVGDAPAPAAHLRLIGEMSGSASLNRLPGFTAQIEVPLVTIDLDWDDASPVDFVKIDVQGHELKVLAGMQKTIANSPDIRIAMEFTPADHQDPLAAIRVIREEMGLSVQTIGHDGMVHAATPEEAAVADTGDHRMLWLTRAY